MHYIIDKTLLVDKLIVASILSVYVVLFLPLMSHDGLYIHLYIISRMVGISSSLN